ncbi:unnamed protein product [Lasius platythorax]|uniref:Uncharacterized protein n=2 Tax=Lasius TaxID=488720 RepID=A0A0J7L5B5_LASNI|nr:hypothetical protein RF55_1506 [Lasius niger]
MGAGQRAAGRQAHSSSTCEEGESVTWRVPRAACKGGGSRSRWWWMNEGGDAGDDGAGGGAGGGGSDGDSGGGGGGGGSVGRDRTQESPKSSRGESRLSE